MISSKPIEIQRALISIWMVSEKSTERTSQSEISEDKKDTAIFISKVLIWEKIVSVMVVGAYIVHNDPRQAEIRFPDDSQLDFIIKFGKIAVNMAGSQRNRIKQLSTHTTTTSTATTTTTITTLHHNYNRIVTLC